MQLTCIIFAGCSENILFITVYKDNYYTFQIQKQYFRRILHSYLCSKYKQYKEIHIDNFQFIT